MHPTPRRRWLAIVAIAAAFAPSVTGCAPTSKQPSPKVIPAERIAFAGHGKLFDAAYKPIKLDETVVAEIQESLLSVLQQSQFKLDDEASASIAKAQGFLKSEQLSADEVILIKGAIIGRWLRDAPKEVRARYDWRGRALVSHYLIIRPELLAQIRETIYERLKDLGFFDPPVDTSTSYMNDCRAQEVPIPPDWAETGTAWVLAGTLTQNRLDGDGAYAAVWTYTDPDRRGACIALPRGSGAVGSAAGIICQSASTGHACFWDNKLRGVEPEQFIGWRGRTLVIADLKDGSNLNLRCTGCHRGSNVYRVSPDDPTWGLVLRTLPVGTNFTTQVEASSDNLGGRPRYIPIAQPEWVNEYSTSPDCRGCHEPPLPSGDGYEPVPMPPLCRTLATGCWAPPP